MCGGVRKGGVEGGRKKKKEILVKRQEKWAEVGGNEVTIDSEK